MLLVGVVTVVVGLVVSWVWAVNPGTSTGLGARAWPQGRQFLGEGFVLASFPFLLALIRSEFREGGGEVKMAPGFWVMTLEMPNTTGAFVVLKVAGRMIEVVQFGLYVYIATQARPDEQIAARRRCREATLPRGPGGREQKRRLPAPQHSVPARLRSNHDLVSPSKGSCR